MYRPRTQGSLAQEGSQEGQGQGSSLYESQISNVGPLPFPLEAQLDATGQTVTLLQTCDWKGHSPSNIGVDQNGKQFIAAFEEVTVTDHRVIPNQQATQIRQNARGRRG